MTVVKLRAKVFNANVFPDGGRGVAVTLYKGLRRLVHYHMEEAIGPDEAVRQAVWRWLSETRQFNRFGGAERELLMRARDEHVAGSRERLYMVGVTGRTVGGTWSDGIGADSVGATYHVRPKMRYKIVIGGPWDASAWSEAAKRDMESANFLWFDRAANDPWCVGSFTVNVDYGADIHELAHRSENVRVVDWLEASSFPPEGESPGSVEVKIDLFSFDARRMVESPSGRTGVELIGAAGIYWKLQKLGYRPATIRELIVLVSTHAGPELDLTVVAMGSRLEFWGNPEPQDNGYEFAESYRRDGEDDFLISTIGAGVDYLGLCTFAAVKQSESEIVVPEIPISYLAA